MDELREYLIGNHTTVYTLGYLETVLFGATNQHKVAQLAAIDLEIVYRTGRSNKCVDALSRFPHSTPEVEVCSSITSVNDCYPVLAMNASPTK